VLNTARIFSVACWVAFPALLLVRQFFPDFLDFGTYEMLNTVVHYFSKVRAPQRHTQHTYCASARRCHRRALGRPPPGSQ